MNWMKALNDSSWLDFKNVFSCIAVHLKVTVLILDSISDKSYTYDGMVFLGCWHSEMKKNKQIIFQAKNISANWSQTYLHILKNVPIHWIYTILSDSLLCPLLIKGKFCYPFNPTLENYNTDITSPTSKMINAFNNTYNIYMTYTH